MVVALEGLDGSGKRTQAIQLKARVERGGGRAEILSFPRYEETGFGGKIADYLNGGFGPLKAVTPYLPALLYAGDRLESLPLIRAAIESGTLLILDRYTASNLAYQGARLEGAEREAFLDWLAKIEHGVYRLPVPDLQIFLSVPPEISMRRVSEKGERNYTSRLRDLHEENAAYLGRCHEVYEFLIETELPSRWKSIGCLRADGEMRSIDDIAEEIWVAINDWPNQSLRS